MSDEKLVVTDGAVFQSSEWRLAWTFEDDFGAVAGEGSSSHDSVACAFERLQVAIDVNNETAIQDAKADLEIAVVNAAASKTAGVQRDQHGYFWETLTQARAALKAVKAALIASKSKTPWPDWAVKAKAAGWRAPKGWKP